MTLGTLQEPPSWYLEFWPAKLSQHLKWCFFCWNMLKSGWNLSTLACSPMLAWPIPVILMSFNTYFSCGEMVTSHVLEPPTICQGDQAVSVENSMGSSPLCLIYSACLLLRERLSSSSGCALLFRESLCGWVVWYGMVLEMQQMRTVWWQLMGDSARVLCSYWCWRAAGTGAGPHCGGRKTSLIWLPETCHCVVWLL